MGYPFNVPPFPGTPIEDAYYPPGSIFTWYAADNKRDAKEARRNPPDGWEYTGFSEKLWGSATNPFNPERGTVKYVLYLRKV